MAVFGSNKQEVLKLFALFYQLLEKCTLLQVISIKILLKIP